MSPISQEIGKSAAEDYFNTNEKYEISMAYIHGMVDAKGKG